MDNQEQTNPEVKDFKFKMDRVEKTLTFVILILFFLSFTSQQSVLFNVVFFGLSALIFTYYFAWYRKKPPYVVIKEDEVVINQLPFFKPCIIKREGIIKVLSGEKSIEIEYTDAGTPNKSSINSLFLDEKDKESILSILST